MADPKESDAGRLERPAEHVDARVSVAGRRVLVVDLDDESDVGARRPASRLSASYARAVGAAPDLARAASRSGPALAASLFVAARRTGGLASPAFVVSVGDAVLRGVPTAARATITAPAPLRDGLTEAQFGGRFGAALARLTDALVVIGCAARPVVLAIDGEGGVRVQRAEVALGDDAEFLSTRDRARRLAGSAGRTHVLTTGPGAQAGLPFANLAQFDGDDLGGAPSIVGRGGLGATVAAAGVVAITVEDTRGVDAAPEVDGALDALLLRSPRLLARSVGGTLELGPLRDGAVDLADAPREKHGCHGCPTPCGWRFDVNVRGGGARVSGRFSALQGFAGHGDTLALVERCNDLGLDARSMAVLFEDAGGDQPVDAFLTDVVTVGTGAHRAGAAVARATSFEREPGATFATADIAARVGQALAARGPEPVRSLSVLGLAGVDARALVAPLVWSGDAEADAGTLAYWHECFAAAVDVTGFCAFSAAGLIADGVADVAELEAILRPGGAHGAGWGIDAPDGAAMLAAGAAHVALHREWAGPDAPDRAGAVAQELPRAVEAYRRAVVRGFEGGSGADAPGLPPDSGASHGRTAGEPSEAEGTVLVSATGVLAARLAEHPLRVAAAGEEGRVRLELPVEAGGLAGDELVAAVAEAHPAAARWLVDTSGRAVPAVVVDGRVVGKMDRVVPGQTVELVLAIPGG